MGVPIPQKVKGYLLYLCRNMLTKSWPYSPKVHIGNPHKDPGFLNQVPTLLGISVGHVAGSCPQALNVKLVSGSVRVEGLGFRGFRSLGFRGFRSLGFRV